ncbi:hypothetical protein DPMN_080476 [Dreissena polymorpha]|uniref:Uncharacterized protein n=1 Tax=Dreissena polymorpha TaxID=45954 RepID=A0A9D4BJ98_DREPO|nr:hypothetical protein DPMN_080476 [Dreissena polymorpha]
MSEATPVSPRKGSVPASLTGAEPKRKSKGKSKGPKSSKVENLPFMEADEFSDVTIIVSKTDTTIMCTSLTNKMKHIKFFPSPLQQKRVPFIVFHEFQLVPLGLHFGRFICTSNVGENYIAYH